MKILFVYLLVLTFFIYSGCATILSGGSDEIDLTSEPTGAKVLINGQNEGKTPTKIKLKKGKEYAIEFVKDGYEPKTFRLSYSLGAGWLILDIFLGGIIGVVVDAATGNWNGFDNDYYKANLEPKEAVK